MKLRIVTERTGETETEKRAPHSAANNLLCNGPRASFRKTLTDRRQIKCADEIVVGARLWFASMSAGHPQGYLQDQRDRVGQQRDSHVHTEPENLPQQGLSVEEGVDGDSRGVR
jgi:hypothetical protein